MSEQSVQKGETYPRIDPDSITKDELLQMIDYTMLRPEETLESYARFLRTASEWKFHAVFIPPAYVPLAVGMLSATDTVVGTPISFPYGYCSPEVKASESVSALEEGVGELDVVINISAALSGEWEVVREDLEAVVAAVRDWEELTLSDHPVLKVILETSYLNDYQIIEACKVASEAGMDFVKTATGLGPGGATVHDVALMKETVGDRVGVKASGGIRTWEDARSMIGAGATRIGTSTGPGIMEGFSIAHQ